MILIKSGNGFTQLGVVVSLRGGELRIAVQGSDDIQIFHLVENTWISETACRGTSFEIPEPAALFSIPQHPTDDLTSPDAAGHLLTNYVN